MIRSATGTLLSTSFCDGADPTTIANLRCTIP